MMNDIMVDLETMDNVASAAIVAIGAVQCDLTTGETGCEFYKVIDLDNQKGTIGTDTAAWWAEQSEEAKNIFKVKDKINVRQMCDEFSTWTFL
jgi:exodeoxyribonuclease VIII